MHITLSLVGSPVCDQLRDHSHNQCKNGRVTRNLLDQGGDTCAVSLPPYLKTVATNLSSCAVWRIYRTEKVLIL